MSDLKTLFSITVKCSSAPDFVSYSDFTECLRYLKELKSAVPKEYPQYEEVIAAANSSIDRIELQKQIKYSQFNSESQFMQSHAMHQRYRTKEIKEWNNLEVSRVEHITKKDENVWQSNASNLTIIGILLFIIFLYRFIVSNKFNKLKARNILRSFNLTEQANLVDKELSHESKFKIFWFGLRTRDENEGVTGLNDSEIHKLNLIYENMSVLEVAYQMDISQNKINVWKGVNLESEPIRLARAHFLNLINEKVKE